MTCRKISQAEWRALEAARPDWTVRGGEAKIRDALHQFEREHIPMSVCTVGLVLTSDARGWRGWVLAVAIVMIRKAGHKVVLS